MGGGVEGALPSNRMFVDGNGDLRAQAQVTSASLAWGLLTFAESESESESETATKTMMMMMTTWICSHCLCLRERWNLMPNNRVDFEMHTKRGDTGTGIVCLAFFCFFSVFFFYLSGALATVQNVELRSWSPCCRCLTFMWTQCNNNTLVYHQTERHEAKPNQSKANQTKPRDPSAIVVG